MNISNHDSNVANIDAPIPLRILVTGDRPAVQSMVDHLCAIGFCDRAKWSPVMPHAEKAKGYFSILTW